MRAQPPAKTTTKGEETRSAILDQALRLSSTIGLESLSLGTLAGEVGLSKSGLFAHFASKEELQIAVIRRARDWFVERVLGPSLTEARGEPRFRAMFENWLLWDDSADLPGGCVFMTFAHELDDQPGALRDELVAALRDWIDALKTAAEIAIEEGHFRADLDIDQLVFECYGIALAHNHFQRTIGSKDATRRAREAYAGLLDRAHPAR